jgi:hypothetical protein
MKKLILLLPIVLLTGCLATAPVVPNWPEVPKELLETCPDLKTLEPNNTKLSTIVETVTDNYQQYYNCKDSVDSWIMWYKGQQDIWKTLK